MENQINSLLSISPIDGRYRYMTKEIAEYFSEFGFFRNCIKVEIKYFISLSKIGVLRNFSSSEIKLLNNIINNFDIKEAEKIKEIEKITRHDKKAIEYYLKNIISKTSLKDVVEYLHFALTSDDITNISIRLSTKECIEKIITPSLKLLSNHIFMSSKDYKDLKILARTHGQAAIPTSLGKEFLVFHERMKIELKILEDLKLKAKLSGAIGNYNAHKFAYPQVNWKKFSKKFISEFNLKQHPATTQIAPYEDLIFAFQTIQRINNIILDFNQDMWRYISDGWFIQENIKGKIGSSTMPQKINPINFEQSEGNIIVANSLIDGFTNKLSISRLQRDLSDSTIARNFGLAFAYSLLSYKLSTKGLSKVKPNKDKIYEDLNKDWSILSEALQIYLKKEGIKNGYEIIKDLTRGEKLTKDEFMKLIDSLPLNKNQKLKLKNLNPNNY